MSCKSSLIVVRRDRRSAVGALRQPFCYTSNPLISPPASVSRAVTMWGDTGTGLLMTQHVPSAALCCSGAPVDARLRASSCTVACYAKA